MDQDMDLYFQDEQEMEQGNLTIDQICEDLKGLGINSTQCETGYTRVESHSQKLPLSKKKIKKAQSNHQIHWDLVSYECRNVVVYERRRSN
ncbi:hypothetical protein pb186bvf_010063 [Paramecium bursaria]